MVKLTLYGAKICVIFIAICTFSVVYNIFGDINFRFQARDVISSVVRINELPVIINNDPEELGEFYTKLMQNLSIWTLPEDYNLVKATISTVDGEYDLNPPTDFVPINANLDGNRIKFILAVMDKGENVYSESTTRLKLTDKNIWDVKNKVRISIKTANLYGIILLVIMSVFFITLYNKIDTVTVLLLISVFLYSVDNIISAKLTTDKYVILRYFNRFSRACLGAVLIIWYIIQSIILGVYNKMHKIFFFIFKNYSMMIITVVLRLFINFSFAKFIFWFVWAPILQCTVLSIYDKINTDNNINKTKTTQLNVVSNVDVNTDGKSNEKIKGGDRCRNYRFVLMLFHIILSINLLVFYKNDEYQSYSNVYYNKLNEPFDVDGVVQYNIKREGSEGNLYTISREVQTATVDKLSNINKASVLDGWLKKIPDLNLKQHSIHYTDRNNVLKPYNDKLFNDVNTLILLLQHNNDSIIVIKLNVGYVIKNLDVTTLKLNHTHLYKWFSLACAIILLTVLLLDCYFNTVSLSVIVTLIMFSVNLIFVIIVFSLVPNLDKIQRIISDLDAGGLSSVVFRVFKYIRMREVMGVTLKINFICLMIYCALHIPRSYTTVNANQTIIRKPIVTNLRNLFVISYQSALILLIWALLGHEMLGSRLSTYNNIYSTLKHLLTFNINIDVKPKLTDPIWVYHNFTISILIIILSGFLATFYFATQDKKKDDKSLCFEEPIISKDDININVNINATHDEIVIFKVLLKSLESYREFIKSEGKVDECNVFVETFYQPRVGLNNKLRFNKNLYIYYERVKRIKIQSYTQKINKLQDDIDNDSLNDNSKRGYLNILQNKLVDAIREIEQFRATNDILTILDKCSVDSKDDPNVRNANLRDDGCEEVTDAKVVDDVHIFKYNTAELEAFILNPNRRREPKVETDRSEADDITKCIHPSDNKVQNPNVEVDVREIEEIVRETTTTNVQEFDIDTIKDIVKQTSYEEEVDIDAIKQIVQESGRKSTERSHQSTEFKEERQEVVIPTNYEEKPDTNEGKIGIFRSKILK